MCPAALNRLRTKGNRYALEIFPTLRDAFAQKNRDATVVSNYRIKKVLTDFFAKIKFRRIVSIDTAIIRGLKDV